MDSLSALGVGCVIVGVAILAVGLAGRRSGERDEVRDLKEAILNGETVEISLEEVARLSWLRAGLPAEATSSDKGDRTEA